MRKRILIIAGLAALLVTGSAYAFVRHERGMRNRPFAERIVGHLTRQLDLTDTQQTQVKTMLEAQRQSVAPLLAQAAKNRQQLHDATASGKFDEAQVRTIAAQQAQTMTELIVAKEKVKAKIYNEVLTAEQRIKADELLKHMDERFARGFHERAATVPVVP